MPQAYYFLGPFGVMGEYAISDQEVRSDDAVPASSRLQNHAWQVTGSWLLTGETNSYRGIVPSHPVTLAEGSGWGAFELVARLTQLEIDPGAFPFFADPTRAAHRATTWGVGFNWHINRNLKWMLDYDQTEFDGGAETLVTQKGEKVIITQLQILF